MKTYILSAILLMASAPASSGLTVITPNGNETLSRGKIQTILWKDAESVPTCPAGAYCMSPALKTYDLRITHSAAPCTGSVCIQADRGGAILLATDVSGTSFNWTVGTASPKVTPGTIADGKYVLTVCRAGTSLCDASDSYFKITTDSAPVTDVTLKSPNGGETWKIGTEQNIMWTGISNVPNTYALWFRIVGGDILGGNLGVINPSEYTNGSYRITVPSTLLDGDFGKTLTPGSYKIKVSLYDGDPCLSLPTCNPNYAWGKLVSEDISNAVFTVTK